MRQKQQLEKTKSDIENFFHALELAKGMALFLFSLFSLLA